MAKMSDPWVCDNTSCGIKKGATNKWFLAWVEPITNVITIRSWDDDEAARDGTSHLCGLDCLAKWTLKEAAKINGVES